MGTLQALQSLNGDNVRKSITGVSLFMKQPWVAGTNINTGNLFNPTTGDLKVARTVTDGATTASSTTVTSATAAFTAADVGSAISGGSIPASASIVSVTNSTTVVISANATATATGVSLTIGPGSSLTGYKDLGYLQDAGIVFSNSITTSDVTGLQSLTPLRTDITADTTTLTLTPEETNQQTIALYEGVDPASIQTLATNGVLRLDRPAAPTPRYVQVLAIASDSQSNGDIIFMKFFPKMLLTARQDQTMAKDGVWTYGVTLSAYKDDTLGFASSTVFGGAGFLARKTGMGFS